LQSLFPKSIHSYKSTPMAPVSGCLHHEPRGKK
jgi:hypothetical protein